MDRGAHCWPAPPADGYRGFHTEATLKLTGMTAKDVAAPNFRERIIHPDDLESLPGEQKAALSVSLFRSKLHNEPCGKTASTGGS